MGNRNSATQQNGEGGDSSRSSAFRQISRMPSMQSLMGSFGVLTRSESERTLGSHQKANVRPVTEIFTPYCEAVLAKAVAFMPFTVQQLYVNGTSDMSEQCIIHEAKEGVVLSARTSGLSELVLSEAVVANGAKRVERLLSRQLKELVEIVTAFRGDVISFTHDGFTAYFQEVDDTLHPAYSPSLPTHGTFDVPEIPPLQLALLRAASCCIAIHRIHAKQRAEFDGVPWGSHIGVSIGPVALLQLGGSGPPSESIPRYDAVLVGGAVMQAFAVMKVARASETCLTREAWRHAAEWAVEGRNLDRTLASGDCRILDSLKAQKYTFPCVRHAAEARDLRFQKRFPASELDYARSFVPPFVFEQIKSSTLDLLSELRSISTVVVSASGVDLTSESGAELVNICVKDVQNVCRAREGKVSKIYVDDKGLLFQIVFGVPPDVHTDDALRATLTCFDVLDAFKQLDVVCRCAVASGTSFCGVIDGCSRKEHTVVGDSVYVALQLLAHTHQFSILGDEATMARCSDEVVWSRRGPSGSVEDLDDVIAAFEPESLKPMEAGGLTADRTITFPWTPTSHTHGGQSKLLEVECWDQRQQLEAALRKRSVSGGLVVVSGQQDMGTFDLAEHAVADMVESGGSLPIFATQPRFPGSQIAPILWLLKSIAAAFRHDKPSLAEARDKDVLAEFIEGCLEFDVEQSLEFGASRTPRVFEESPGARKAWYRYNEGLGRVHIFQATAVNLVKRLLQDRPVTCVLSRVPHTDVREESGSQESQALVNLMAEFVNMASGQPPNPLVVVLVTHRDLENIPQLVGTGFNEQCFIRAKPLSEIAIASFIGRHLDVRHDTMPEKLHQLVGQITGGKPLFIIELLDYLVESGHIAVTRNHFGSNEVNFERTGLEPEQVDLFASLKLTMIRRTACMIESLDPLQAAIVKMASVFSGSFTAADMAASIYPRWAGATFAELFRLHRAATSLVRIGILDPVDSEHSVPGAHQYSQRFKLNNYLIRCVAGSMLGSLRRLSVKRQALMERFLHQEWHSHMEKLRTKEVAQHIPWYYQVQV